MIQKTITASGNAIISTNRAKFGTSSASFDGNGDGLIVTAHPDFDFGLNDFTIEFWIYETALDGATYFVDARSTTTGPNQLLINGTDTNTFFWASNANRITGPAITKNQWVHIAASRSSGITRLFIDGTQVGSDYTDTNSYDLPNLTIGMRFDGSATIPNTAVTGNIDELRISTNARYTTNFTPPTSAFVPDQYTVLLIHAEGNQGSTLFVDDNYPYQSGSVSLQSVYGITANAINLNQNNTILNTSFNMMLSPFVIMHRPSGMRSLSELNDWHQAFVLDYYDERDSQIIFNNLTTTNPKITINQGKNHYAPVGIEIIEFVQSELLNTQYSIDISSLGNDAYLQWDEIAPGCAVNQVGKVYTITGIDSVEKWDLMKSPFVYTQTAGFGDFEYHAVITYKQTETKSWMIELVIQPGLFLYTNFSFNAQPNMMFSTSKIYLNITNNLLMVPDVYRYIMVSTPSDNIYVPGTNDSLDAYPIVDVNPNHIWTCVVSADFNDNVDTISSTGTGGTFSYNPTTKVATITGTETQLNSRLQNLKVLTTANKIYDYRLNYFFYNTGAANTLNINQNMLSTDTTYFTSTQPDTYSLNTPKTLSNTPIITDNSYSGTNNYTIEITSSDVNAIGNLVSRNISGTNEILVQQVADRSVIDDITITGFDLTPSKDGKTIVFTEFQHWTEQGVAKARTSVVFYRKINNIWVFINSIDTVSIFGFNLYSEEYFMSNDGNYITMRSSEDTIACFRFNGNLFIVCQVLNGKYYDEYNPYSNSKIRRLKLDPDLNTHTVYYDVFNGSTWVEQHSITTAVQGGIHWFDIDTFGIIVVINGTIRLTRYNISNNTIVQDGATQIITTSGLSETVFWNDQGRCLSGSKIIDFNNNSIVDLGVADGIPLNQNFTKFYSYYSNRFIWYIGGVVTSFVKTITHRPTYKNYSIDTETYIVKSTLILNEYTLDEVLDSWNPTTNNLVITNYKPYVNTYYDFTPNTGFTGDFYLKYKLTTPTGTVSYTNQRITRI